MNEEELKIKPQLIALVVGISVTAVTSLLTAATVLFPLNVLISVSLGGAAGYGALKILDPRTPEDAVEATTNAEYQLMLKEIAGIAARTGSASQLLSNTSPEVSARLDHIARMAGMILERYRARPRDFAGVSAMHMLFQNFNEILSHYLKVKRGELFLAKDQSEIEIAEAEMKVIPMFENSLDTLGQKLDAGETLDKVVARGTLESMLESLNLIESLQYQMASLPEKGESYDQDA